MISRKFVKKIMFLVICLNSFFSSFSILNAQWIRQLNGLPNPEKWYVGMSIDACDAKTVVIAIYMYEPVNTTTIFKTVDGGDSWQNISIPNENTIDVSIIDGSHIWAIMENGKIFATTNGGLNWKLQFYDKSRTDFGNFIKMFDLNNGIAMGDPPTGSTKPAVFLKTTDGGNSWTIVADVALNERYSDDTWRRLDFPNFQTGFFSGSKDNQPQKLFKSTDNGNSWKEIMTPGSPNIIKFYNEKIGLASSLVNKDNKEKEYVFRTLDGGITWDTISLIPDGNGNDFEFLPRDSSKVWYTDYNNLYFSTDTGRIWTLQYSFASGTDPTGARDIAIVDSKNGWILTDAGVYHTTTGGLTATENMKNFQPEKFYLSQNYPNPFNPNTTIKFRVSSDGFLKQYVLLKVYNSLGEEISNLVDEFLHPGEYQVQFNGTNLSSGVYYYKISSGNFSEIKKLLLLK